MLATALVLAAGLVLASPAAGPDVAQVAAVLERNAGSPDARLLAELRALGPAQAADLFTVLAFGPSPERALESREEGALAQALASFGPATLRPLFRSRLAKDPSVEERFAALHVLARFGRSDDLPFLRTCMQSASGGLVDALVEAGAGILGRDPRALESVRRWMLEAPLDVGAALARAVATSGCTGATAALAQTLGYRAELD